MVWWLRRFALTYLLPNENLYAEMSPSLTAAFGRDSEGASWITGLLLNKIESNLRTQTAEPGLMEQTLQLLTALVDTSEKRKVVINSGPFWTLVRLHSSAELLQLCGTARRHFFQALTVAGAGANGSLGGLGDQNYFWNQVDSNELDRFNVSKFQSLLPPLNMKLSITFIFCFDSSTEIAFIGIQMSV